MGNEIGNGGNVGNQGANPGNRGGNAGSQGGTLKILSIFSVIFSLFIFVHLRTLNNLKVLRLMLLLC